MYILNRPDVDHSLSVLLHYMTLNKPGVSVEIGQADSLLQAHWQCYNLKKKPMF